jgi:hypothetical protein
MLGSAPAGVCRLLNYQAMTARFKLVTICVLAIATACGGSSPTSPADSDSTTGASITGSILSGGPSARTSATTGQAITGLTVTIVGTSISSGLDASGRFNLKNVPAGDLQLQFSGPVSGTLSVNGVQTTETITLVISVSGTTVTLESEARSGGSEEQLEGKIQSLPPAMPAGSLKVAGRTVTTDSSTVIRKGETSVTLAELKVDYRVHVKGHTSGSSLVATQIIVQNTNSDTSDDEDDDEQDSSASIHGVLNSIGGSIPALTLNVGGTTVRTSADTDVKRKGDVQTLSQLKTGQDLHVIGTRQPDGSIDARHIEINDDATGGEVEIQGSAGGVSGACPTLSFGVNGYKVSTTATTAFEGIACTALKSGTKVTVKGISQANNSIIATNVKAN